MELKNVALGEAPLQVSHPDILTSDRRAVSSRPAWMSVRQAYRLRAGEAAEFERLKSWSAAADAWTSALEVATGGNVRWCRDRHAWCIARSLKPER